MPKEIFDIVAQGVSFIFSEIPFTRWRDDDVGSEWRLDG